MKRLVWLAAFAFGLGIGLPTWAQSPGNFSTLSTTGTATMGGDVLMCSGRPWIDVRCNGALGDDSHDDTTAINTTISTAITNNWPVHLSAGTYKVTSAISIDYAGQASKGFRLISEAATIDGRTIASARSYRSSAVAVRLAARRDVFTSRKREAYSSTPAPRPMRWCSARPISPTRTTLPNSTT